VRDVPRGLVQDFTLVREAYKEIQSRHEKLQFLRSGSCGRACFPSGDGERG